jgi:MATE family multidrug resistance protein
MSLVRRDLKELVRLSGPAIASRLSGMVMGLTDTVVVGRHSATELGYMALAWAPSGMMLVTAMGLLNGVPVMAAQKVGEGRAAGAGAVLRRGAVYSAQLGVLAAVVLFAAGPFLLARSGVERDLARGAGEVLKILAYSTPMALVGMALSYYLEAIGKPARAAAVAWFANGVNLAIDLVLVPRFGAQGAAWATFGARVLMLALLAALVLGDKDARAMGVFDKPARDRVDEVRQRRIGYAAGAALFAEAGAFSGMNIVAGWVGGLTVAGWAIVLNVAALVFMVPLGVAAAASVLVARAHGADDRPGVRRAGKLVFGLATLLTGLLSLVVALFADPIAAAYTTDPPLHVLAAGAMMLAAAFFVADGLQVVGAQMLRAAGDAWTATWAQLFSYGAVMLPLGWLLALPFHLGLHGIVWAALIASLVSAGLLVSRFAWISRS